MIKDIAIAILVGIAIAQRITQPGDPARVAVILVVALMTFSQILCCAHATGQGGGEKKMMYEVCEYCGSTLDHGEKCDCQKESPESENTVDEGNEGMPLMDGKRPAAIIRRREE